VADRHRQGVGGVVGLRRLRERQQRADHPLHLLLLRAARAAHGLLDRLGGVGEARHPREARREEHRAAGLADCERGAHVLAEEEVLDRHGRGPVLADQVAHARVDAGEPPLQGLGGPGPDHPAIERRQPLPAREHHAVAGVRGSGVDPEHDHAPGRFCAGARTPPGTGEA
jgi:hypothetical protein